MFKAMEITETNQLISGCLAGDELCIESLVRQYEAGVFRLALSVVDDPAEAGEVTQDTFIAALGALRTYQERSTFKAWLYTIAINLSRSRLRKRKTLQKLKDSLTALFSLETQKTASPEEAVIASENDARIWKALNALDEKHRLPVILRYFHSLSVTEIAEILKINEGTIHSRLHNARERLRVELDALPGD